MERLAHNYLTTRLYKRSLTKRSPSVAQPTRLWIKARTANVLLSSALQKDFTKRVLEVWLSQPGSE
jgi:hypothetical protein